MTKRKRRSVKAFDAIFEWLRLLFAVSLGLLYVLFCALREILVSFWTDKDDEDDKEER